jgi:DNA-directed RNA polymerase specialized sigma24 family protein
MGPSPARPAGRPRRTLAVAGRRPSLTERAGRAVTAQEVRAALAALSPQQRQVIVEIYFHHRSVAETGDLLRICATSVVSLAYSAVRQLPRALVAAADDAAAASAPGRPGRQRGRHGERPGHEGLLMARRRSV